MNQMKEILIGVVYAFLVYLFFNFMNYLESFSELLEHIVIVLLVIPLIYIGKHFSKKKMVFTTSSMGVSYLITALILLFTF